MHFMHSPRGQANEVVLHPFARVFLVVVARFPRWPHGDFSDVVAPVLRGCNFLIS